MDKYKKLRWVLLFSALATTIGAILYPVDESSSITGTQGVKPDLAMRPSSTAPAQVEREHVRPIWVTTDENPFAPRAWQAPSIPQTEVARAVQTVELTQAPQEPPATPLPYRFLGQMQDGDSHVFYLGRGDQVLLARQGEVLEGSYKVVAINDSMIEFESVQSGIKQTLPILAQ
jgi:hypothetical protein